MQSSIPQLSDDLEVGVSLTAGTAPTPDVATEDVKDVGAYGEDADSEADIETLERSARETTEDWFGDADATIVRFTAEILGSAKQENAPELYIRGSPLSEQLDNDALSYYRTVLIPTLLREGRAAWRGTVDLDGAVRDGVIATLAQDHQSVELMYALRVEENAWTEVERMEEQRDTRETPSVNDKENLEAIDLDVFMTKRVS